MLGRSCRARRERPKRKISGKSPVRFSRRWRRGLDMRTFVALVRGINVGAARKLPMADLRLLCLELGLKSPQTYIQSGNLIVDAAGDGRELSALLERELAGRFGFSIKVVVRTAADWQRYVAANPFAADPGASPKMVHLYLSREAVKPHAAEKLQRWARGGERIAMAGGALWIDYGAQGVHGSALGPTVIDDACGSPTTGRNWTSVRKIHEMIKARLV
jgi:uncharacterized protein (DUF1697 family)